MSSKNTTPAGGVEARKAGTEMETGMKWHVDFAQKFDPSNEARWGSYNTRGEAEAAAQKAREHFAKLASRTGYNDPTLQTAWVKVVGEDMGTTLAAKGSRNSPQAPSKAQSGVPSNAGSQATDKTKSPSESSDTSRTKSVPPSGDQSKTAAVAKDMVSNLLSGAEKGIEHRIADRNQLRGQALKIFSETAPKNGLGASQRINESWKIMGSINPATSKLRQANKVIKGLSFIGTLWKGLEIAEAVSSAQEGHKAEVLGREVAILGASLLAGDLVGKSAMIACGATGAGAPVCIGLSVGLGYLAEIIAEEVAKHRLKPMVP